MEPWLVYRSLLKAAGPELEGNLNPNTRNQQLSWRKRENPQKDFFIFVLFGIFISCSFSVYTRAICSCSPSAGDKISLTIVSTSSSWFFFYFISLFSGCYVFRTRRRRWSFFLWAKKTKRWGYRCWLPLPFPDGPKPISVYRTRTCLYSWSYSIVGQQQQLKEKEEIRKK